MDAAVVLAFFAAALVCYVHSPSILTGRGLHSFTLQLNLSNSRTRS